MTAADRNGSGRLVQDAASGDRAPATRRNPGYPGLVILDFDGVLVDSEVMSLGELHAALNDHGVEIPLDEVRTRFLGTSLGKIAGYVGTHGTDQAGFAERWHGALYTRFRNELTVMPGALEVLDAFDALGIPYCIASSGSFERLGVALGAVGLQDRFEGRVFSADLVRRGKPAPDLFLLTAERTDVPASDCIVVEDSPAGAAAAASAGMACLGFVGGSHLAGIREAHADLLRANGARCIANRFRPDEILDAVSA